MPRLYGNGAYFFAGWEAAKDFFNVGEPNKSYSSLEEANMWRQYWRDYDADIFDPEDRDRRNK